VAADVGNPAVGAAAQIVARVIWMPRAIHDLEAIRGYLDQFNEAASARLSARLVTLGESLADFPERGSPLPNGRRQLATVWPYLLYYRYDGEAVRILGIRHGAREGA
jgi:toxin ParE1/3/4